MTVYELTNALQSMKSRSKRALLDEAADCIQRLDARNGMLEEENKWLRSRLEIAEEFVRQQARPEVLRVRLDEGAYGTEVKQFSRGDKITQLVVLPVLYPRVEQTEEIQGGDRGDGGFGSTGR